MPLDADYQSRLEALYQWRRDFAKGNSGLPNAAADVDSNDIQLCDRVTAVFANALAEVFGAPPALPAALTEWDAALAEMKTDLAALLTSNGTSDDLSELALAAHSTSAPVPGYIARFESRYRARMDYVRALAGIVPKSESSSSDAGGCWIDHGDAFWWADESGYYLPAFTNQAYVSARRHTETGVPYSTMEFGFGLVVACPDRLRLGDTITLNIEQVDGDRPYQVGDEAVLQTIAAGPAWLAGGVDGTDVQTWRVAGSTSGALPDYVVPTDGTPAPLYAQAGVGLRLAPGGIPFALGDAFTLAVEAGQYRWRQNGGPWSAMSNIPANGEAPLTDGLKAIFEPGAAPSFVPGDAYAFAVHQPWAVSHLQAADAAPWGWDGAAAQLVVDLGSVQAVEAVGLARYQLPEGATVQVETSNDNAAWTAAVPLDVSSAVCVAFVRVTARYLRVSVAGAAGGHIGWLWAGVPMQTDHHASSCTRRRRWQVGRGSGINPAGLYAGRGDGWTLSWSPEDWVSSNLIEADMALLLPLLDWAQQKDEPLILVPHYLHPQDAALVRYEADALEVTDKMEYQPYDQAHQLLSATLELEPVYA